MPTTIRTRPSASSWRAIRASKRAASPCTGRRWIEESALKQTRRGFLAATTATVFASCTSMGGARLAEGPGRAPWRHSTPDAHGLDLAALEEAAAELAAPGERQGLVVIRHGELVYEKYWANAWARA